MASDATEDKLTIKNMLFTKALPNYTLPVEPEGHKIFPCTDCGDKFLLESSYIYHINRKSLKITYFCRYCSNVSIFYNRCKLLSHIRSHTFKTATINISDIKLEPLPLQDIHRTETSSFGTIELCEKSKHKVCFECDEVIESTGSIQKDRAKHYMRYTEKVYMCPVCLFTVPNTCILAAHLRIHLKIPPYFCPECGINLSSKSIDYPYYHDCEGFKMIRATTRLHCTQKGCNKVFHPNDYREHLKTHIKKMYKCIKCLGLWYNERPRIRHSPCKLGEDKIEMIFQCQICPNKEISKGESVHVYGHLNKHFKSITDQNKDQIYPCLICNITFSFIPQLIKHHIDCHGASNETLSKFLIEPESKNTSKRIYRVVKRCDKCLRSFIYRCQLESINILPNECPYKCSSSNEKNKCRRIKNNNIVCGICKQNINDAWKDVKVHFAKYHKNHKCLDLSLSIPKISLTNNVFKESNHYPKYRNKINKTTFKIQRKCNKNKTSFDNKKFIVESKSVSEVKNRCGMCVFSCDDVDSFEKHIITHRDPYMAYQCLECGHCFVVKPSFSTHLLLEHNITDVDEYINKKKCFNELALSTITNNSEKINEPVKENQCSICREQFDNSHDFEKHFRMHGMAFLMKKKNNSP